MAKIKIKDIPKDRKISKEEMKKVFAGASGVPGMPTLNRYGASGVPGMTTMIYNPYGASGVPG